MFNWFKKKVDPAPILIGEILPPEVIKEPKLKATTCSFCGCIYQPNTHHLRPGIFSLGVKRMTMCPVCNQENVAEFEEGEAIDWDKIQELIAKDTKTYPIMLAPNKYTGLRYIVCPHCRETLHTNGDSFIKLKNIGEHNLLYNPEHCKSCGQSLDWGNIAEEISDGNQ